MLRWVAAFCRPLRPVLLLVSFPRSRSPVVGVLGLCWMWHGESPPLFPSLRIRSLAEPLASDHQIIGSYTNKPNQFKSGILHHSRNACLVGPRKTIERCQRRSRCHNPPSRTATAVMIRKYPVTAKRRQHRSHSAGPCQHRGTKPECLLSIIRMPTCPCVPL